MANYSVFLNDHSNQSVKELADMTGSPIEDLLADLINEKLAEFKIDLVLMKFKAGEMKAREAWKATGLNYQEFLQRSQ